MTNMWFSMRGVTFDRSLFSDDPTDDLPHAAISYAEAADALMREFGVEHLVWEIRDDGVVFNIIPIIPGDCLPEAAQASALMRAMLDKKEE